MRNSAAIPRRNKGFSLAEITAALVIASMIMIAVLTIYDNVKSSAASINERLDRYTLPNEILQRIAEDLDRLVTPGLDTTITLENKYDTGFATARMVITSQIYDSNSKPRVFEKVVWQSNYDPETNRLVLYRSHSGIALEDTLLSRQEAESKEMGMELFVPICTGVSFFGIQALQGQKPISSWTSDSLPRAVEAVISFAEPIESPTGGIEIPEEEKITRTIAINRTRKIGYNFAKAEQYERVEKPGREERRERPKRDGRMEQTTQ